MLVPADKGNMTVIMNATDHKRKIEDHLDDPDTYTALDYDPSNEIRKEVKLLKNIIRHEIISE